MTTVPTENSIDTIREQAATWLVDLQSPDCCDFAGLDEWLDRSAEHRLVWEETRRMWQVLGAAPLHYERISTPPASAPDATVAPLSRSSGRRSSRGNKRKILLGAIVSASLCFAALAIAPRLLIRWQADYLTTTAEIRSITLEDGSIVQLGASSAISTNFSAGRREVTLLDGEAFFDVSHDAARPFVVDAAGIEVEVLGTSFDVRLGKSETDIGLARGSIRASTTENGTPVTRVLSPGDLLSIDHQTGKMAVNQVSTDDIGAWRGGRLLVANSTVSDVVAQIQRYHPAWITIPDAELGALRVSGVYDLSNPEKALQALISAHGGKIRKISPAIRLITRL